MAYANPKYTREIINKLVGWFNDHLEDPYEQRKLVARDNFVYGEDFKIQGILPKVHVHFIDYEPVKLNSQTKSTYLEEEAHNFMIYYYNQKDHKFTFAETGLTLMNSAQGIQFLQELKNQVKLRITDFNLFFHKHKFGILGRPIFDRATSSWATAIPLTVYTYRR